MTQTDTACRRKQHPWYDYRPVLAYNGVFTFIVGGRGIGKSYGAKKHCVKRALKRGEQFIYLRRYSEELKSARNTFMADIIEEFPDYDFKIDGNRLLSAPSATEADKKRPWRVLGFFIALSRTQAEKSTAYPNVHTILFDEFIIEKGHIRYLPDEFTVFVNFYSTVDRYQDRVKVLFLANAVSIMNPYFIELDIMPPDDAETFKDEFVVKGIKARKELGGKSHPTYIVVHFPDDEAFRSSIAQTHFGTFISNTEYAKYAVGNKFVDGNDVLVRRKQESARYLYSIELRSGMLSVWYDMKTSTFYMQEKQPKQPLVFTVYPDLMTEDKLLVTKTEPPIQNVKHAFRRGKLVFDSPKSRNAFAEVFKS